MPFQRPHYVNIVLLTGTEDDLGYKDYLLGLSITAGKSVVPFYETGDPLTGTEQSEATAKK